MGLYSIDRTLPLTDELEAVVAEAYALFRPYTIGSALIVCHCNVCMDQETERTLVRTPLREIPARLLAEYTNSAHPWDDGQAAREMRYFLPRYMELIAGNDPPDTMGLGICLRRLRDADWRAKWPPAESGLIDRFFDALVRAAMERLGVIPWDSEPELKADMDDILTLVVTSGGDTERALRVWDAGPPLGSALHMAAVRKRLSYKRGKDHTAMRIWRPFRTPPTQSRSSSSARRWTCASRMHSLPPPTPASSSYSPMRQVDPDACRS